MSLLIRAAAPADCVLIFSLVRELADYEKVTHEMDATVEQISAALFAREPRLYRDIAEWNGKLAGFAVWFLNFSTFRGRHGIYVENLFVRPAFRTRCIGSPRVASRKAGRASNGRYSTGTRHRSRTTNRFGTDVMNEWRICRLSGEALQDFAGTAS